MIFKSCASLLVLPLLGCLAACSESPRDDAVGGSSAEGGGAPGGGGPGGGGVGGTSPGEGGSGGGGGAGGSEPMSTCPAGSLEFRALMIIKNADIASPSVHVSFGQDEIDAATTGFKTQAGAWISQITNGRLCFVGDVFVSPRPLTTLSGACTPTNPWVNDVQDDLAEVAPDGKYDSVLLYAPPGDGGDPNCGGGPPQGGRFMTFAYIIPRGADAWRDEKNDVYDAIIHEWMHGVIGFYENKAGVGPVPNIDSAGTYGYDHDPDLGWKKFLGDVLNRQVMDNGALTGLGEPAWAYGNIRDAER